MGFVFQHINLLPNFNALENVMIPLICHDVDPAEYKDSALELLTQLGCLNERILMLNNSLEDNNRGLQLQEH